MSRVSPENLLLVGKVIRPHGLEGLLRIWSYAQSKETFLKSGTVFLESGSGKTHEYRVLSIRPHRNIFLLKLEGLRSLDDAEKYRGAGILISKDALGHEGEEEYFWHELIGLRVYLNTGRYIGTIRDILRTGSNDIYVVRKGKAEVLVPAIHEVVEEIDLREQRMIISEKEGMLDLNEV